MRVIQKFVQVFVLIVACCIITAVPSMAAEHTQDGLKVVVSTDKTEYGSQDPIRVEVSVTNTNEEALTNVSVETLIPDGLKTSENTLKSFEILAGGQTVSFGSTLYTNDSASEGQVSSGSDSESPGTGDSWAWLLWITLGIISGGTLVILLIMGKKGKRILSLILCVAILGSILSVLPMSGQAAQELRSFELSSPVTVDNTEFKIGVRVQYNFGSTSDTAKDSYTVTFETNGGSAIEPQTVKAGQLATRPENPSKEGSIFGTWYSNEACTEYFDFDETVITEDITLYALWMDLYDETDSDGDQLTDSFEKYIKTDPFSADTDGDGLSDYDEVMNTATDPNQVDTDGDGIEDGKEDPDQDGLNHREEIQYGTNPLLADTDSDGLTDYEELYIYGTDPLVADTDGDAVSDKKELNFGYDPLTPDERFHVTLTSGEEDTVEASVDIALDASQVESLEVERNINDTLFPETIPGYIGGAYDFTVDGTFSSAEIRFAFDEALLSQENFDPTVYYFNEEAQQLEPLETTVSGNVASASVEHFSTYILINRTVYEDAFTWKDVWDANSYTGVELILVIDDSSSMRGSDPSNQRLSVAQGLVDRLPANSKVGVVRFHTRTEILTPQLTADAEQAKSFLTSEYFQATGLTYMYGAINEAFSLFGSSDDSSDGSSDSSSDGNMMKMIVVLSDGEAQDTDKHSSIVSEASAQGIKVYSVGLGSSTWYFQQYLEPLSNHTGGKFYLAEDAEELEDIYWDISEKIDIETDSDSDGIPDYYEDNMVLFNGVSLVLDKNNPDTDGDGLLDGEEMVELKYEYNEDRTQVIVTGKLKSNPTSVDSDGDGLYDNQDRVANGKVVAPKDPYPLKYNGEQNLWKTHVAQQQYRPAPTQYGGSSGLEEEIPKEVADKLVNAALEIRAAANSGVGTAVVKFFASILRWFSHTKYSTVGGAYLLNFVMDEQGMAYHSQPDTWQRDLGYNDFYDDIFKMTSAMALEKIPFDYNGKEYILWLWKGDYWNLHSGAEMGLYIERMNEAGTTHYDAINFELPMTISLYNYKSPTNIRNIFSWMPQVEQWWATGFNPYEKNPNPSDMAVIGSIDFTENRALFQSLRRAAQEGLDTEGEMLLFDEEKSTVWVCWYEEEDLNLW